MKKQNIPPINLRDAFSPTPDMCRDAVLHAVSAYREERRMKKTYVTILAAALALLLIGGAAFALVNYYSVRDYIAEGTPSQQFEENITAVEQTKSSHGLTFTLGDAVFDGSRLAAAMNFEADDSAKTLFVYPVLEAWQGDLLLDSFATFNGSVEGSLFPYLTEGAPRTKELGISAEIYDELSAGDVQWKLSVYLYDILWPIEVIEQSADGDWRAPEEEVFREYFLNQKLLSSGQSLSFMESAIWTKDPKWLERSPVCANGNSFPEMMVNAGAFALADTIVFDFITAQPEAIELAKGQVFHFDEYDVEVKSITQTFMQVDYELELRYHEHPGEIENRKVYEMSLENSFTMFDQDGNELKWLAGGSDLEDDLVTVHVNASFRRISDEPLTSLTFRLNDHFVSDEYYEANADRLIFTVDIEP